MRPLSESGLRPRLDEFATTMERRNFMAEVGCDETGIFLFLYERDCGCEAHRFVNEGGLKLFSDDQLRELGKLFHEYSVSHDGAEKEIVAMNLCMKIVAFMGPAKLEDPAEVWLREHDPKYVEKNWKIN